MPCDEAVALSMAALLGTDAVARRDVFANWAVSASEALASTTSFSSNLRQNLHDTLGGGVLRLRIKPSQLDSVED